ncbi:hypothetical protein [Methanoregula sp.]|jgi:FtsH-binding integral membrane protein|uniref:hypothetical protein n=1 Tax=Methanoregula sp. TaxID=2052170 RepID=UPI0025F09CBC|nr:hypothetical protein [Methanoregula sp.]
MSQTYTFIALGALIIALILLVLYYRAETREAGAIGDRRPLPGKYFVVILLACTFLGMAITESQGVCWLSPWGFIAGIIFGAAAEIAVYLNSGKKTKACPVGSGNS